jgi:hypothetical protein
MIGSGYHYLIYYLSITWLIINILALALSHKLISPASGHGIAALYWGWDLSISYLVRV